MTLGRYGLGAVAFDAGVLVLSALAFTHVPGALPEAALPILILALAGALGSVLFLLGPEGVWSWALAIGKTLAYVLLLLTVSQPDVRLFPATLGWALVLALLGPPRGLVSMAVFAASVAGVICSMYAGVWPSGGWDLGLWAFCSAAALGLGGALRRLATTLGRMRAEGDLQAEEIARLTHANLGFQRYASLLEAESSRAERLRLSREIHDSAGYALTTLKMLFEAAKGLLRKEPGRVDALMDEGARIAQEALGEIRFVLRELRGREEPVLEGLRLVVLLVRNFEKACGIRVRLETSNAKSSYGPRVNATLYRMVQEGMTNAFHHGRATEVSILVAEVEGHLKVHIRDNGRGSTFVKKGIGLSGMEERLSEVGGWLDYHTRERGFEITAQIPLEAP